MANYVAVREAVHVANKDLRLLRLVLKKRSSAGELKQVANRGKVKVAKVALKKR